MGLTMRLIWAEHFDLAVIELAELSWRGHTLAKTTLQKASPERQGLTFRSYVTDDCMKWDA